MPENKPQVVVSRCLGFESCRWDGEMVADGFVCRLSPHVAFRTVCPETEMGLGVPREPIQIESEQGALRLVQPATRRDLTREMLAFRAGFLASLPEVDGFLLKARSPSCAPGDADIHSAADDCRVLGRGPGLFAAAAQAAFPHLAVESEQALQDTEARERFLTRIFAAARLRSMERTGTLDELIAFHSRNQLLLMAHDPAELEALDVILANRAGLKVDELLPSYRSHFLRALSAPPRRSSRADVLARALERLSPRPAPREEDHLHEALAAYRARSLPWSAVLRIALPHLARSSHARLEEQTFFSPFPEELSSLP